VLGPVSQAHPLVCLSRAADPPRLHHVDRASLGSPPGKPHEVLLLTTFRPAVGERVPKAVRMEMLNTGLGGTTLEELAHT